MRVLSDCPLSRIAKTGHIRFPNTAHQIYFSSRSKRSDVGNDWTTDTFQAAPSSSSIFPNDLSARGDLCSETFTYGPFRRVLDEDLCSSHFKANLPSKLSQQNEFYESHFYFHLMDCPKSIPFLLIPNRNARFRLLHRISRRIQIKYLC